MLGIIRNIESHSSETSLSPVSRSGVCGCGYPAVAQHHHAVGVIERPAAGNVVRHRHRVDPGGPGGLTLPSKDGAVVDQSASSRVDDKGKPAYWPVLSG